MPKTRQKNVTPQKQAEIIGLPEDIAAIRAEIRKFFATKDASSKRIGSYKHGVYAFYDYDGEPIYVGQTEEKLSGRVSRHLTNQRTDAVAMNVLDPFEVASIEAWPLDDLVRGLGKKEKKALLDRAEYTVFQKVLRESALGAILNEKEMAPRNKIALPISYKQRIIPDVIYRGMCRQLLKLDSFRFTFLCAFPLRSELFNDPFGVSRHPDYDRGVTAPATLAMFSSVQPRARRRTGKS